MNDSYFSQGKARICSLQKMLKVPLMLLRNANFNQNVKLLSQLF